jgi:hypothetical protein
MRMTTRRSADATAMPLAGKGVSACLVKMVQCRERGGALSSPTVHSIGTRGENLDPRARAS